MKRTLTNIMTFIFLGFLLIGAIGIFQNIISDVQKSFVHDNTGNHILAYRKI